MKARSHFLATPADFEHIIQALKQSLVKPTMYLTYRVAFGQIKEKFAQWLTSVAGVLKAVVALL
ncbi:hypothetical protein GO988_03760 [Hymenobacter sp. HMF4947]|uniref:Uncharacterized protein n=1 Tax=Hymenobacter ginkgonis TaxID=2682976 RepID=A0A7K1TAK9_9BACT|nr:hypothetical protein [Hymenobacter ginkgonis]MVN75434.1 hypothetical protein [Hymenobacter ginkgonis]